MSFPKFCTDEVTVLQSKRPTSKPSCTCHRKAEMQFLDKQDWIFSWKAELESKVAWRMAYCTMENSLNLLRGKKVSLHFAFICDGYENIKKLYDHFESLDIDNDSLSVLMLKLIQICNVHGIMERMFLCLSKTLWFIRKSFDWFWSFFSNIF